MNNKINKCKIVCIIPARGGSKGVPQKNIKLLAGKPLICHSIEQVLQAKHEIDLYVTTDAEDIARVAKSAGSQIIDRPEHLSGDLASSESALLHALDIIEAEQIVDYVVFLQCTSVFRSADDIDGAIELIMKSNADSLLSVIVNHRFLWRASDQSAESINYDFNNRPRRQDMENQYQENGSIYIFKPWVLRERNNRLGGKIVLYEMDERSAVDIDSKFDFTLAEYLLGHADSKDT